MNSSFLSLRALMPAALALGLTQVAGAAIVSNGGFESGFTGWTRTDLPGSDGGFFAQTGTTSPVNGEAVPAPPQGTTAAMTDAQGPGSHALYQDFIVPAGVTQATLKFSLHLNNSFAGDYRVASHLDFGTLALNQQARVDILTAGSDPFSVQAADILLNAFKTSPGDPLVSGYTAYSIDVTSLLQAQAGQTLRLRFAEVDNVAPLIFGVDQVSIDLAAVPDTGASAILLAMGGLAVGWFRRGR